jgi:hypothetical protein
VAAAVVVAQQLAELAHQVYKQVQVELEHQLILELAAQYFIQAVVVAV